MLNDTKNHPIQTIGQGIALLKTVNKSHPVQTIQTIDYFQQKKVREKSRGKSYKKVISICYENNLYNKM